MLWKVLDGLRRSLDGSGLFGKALGSSGVGSGRFWAFLGSSGRLWMGAGRALDGFGWGSECSPGTDLDGSGRP